MSAGTSYAASATISAVRVLAAVGMVIATPMLVVSAWTHDALMTAFYGFTCAVACLSIAWRMWTTNLNPKDTP